MTVIDDFENYMKSKNYADRSIESYTSCLKKYLAHFKRSPQNITLQEIRAFLAQIRCTSTKKQYVGAIRILYSDIVPQPTKLEKIKYPRKEKRLPQILDKELILTKIGQIDNLKHKAIVATLYGTGVRISELLSLQIADLTQKKGHIRVNQGKGNKDRLIPISDKLLELLRSYYRQYRPKVFLFEGSSGSRYSTTSVRNVIRKHISPTSHPHLLRHSYATHLIENGTDVTVVSPLLGHTTIKTTMIYVHVADQLAKLVKHTY